MKTNIPKRGRRWCFTHFYGNLPIVQMRSHDRAIVSFFPNVTRKKVAEIMPDNPRRYVAFILRELRREIDRKRKEGPPL